MNCPICNIELKPADRGGIEIDYCPRCRGVWVAREELDRILVQPTPFDADWGENSDECTGDERVLLGLNDGAPDHRGARAGFWTSLFGSD